MSSSRGHHSHSSSHSSHSSHGSSSTSSSSSSGTATASSNNNGAAVALSSTNPQQHATPSTAHHSTGAPATTPHAPPSASTTPTAAATPSTPTPATGTGTGGGGGAHSATPVSLLTIIQNQDPVALSKLVQLLKELNDFKRKISVSSKKNFQLEGDIDVLDKKIALLIKHRTTIDEVLKAKGEMVTQQLSKTVSFKTTQEAEAYGRLFWLLQRKTQYISKVARLIKLGEIDNFLQTVMFTLFGNQYEEEEEHLLLSMFQCVLQAEFAEVTSIVNILRANTALTRMLNTYTRRGPGQQYLKQTLTPILAKTVADPNLNLEINPAKVFEAYVNDYESKEGKSFTEERKLTTEQCAAHPKVKEIIAPRMAHLERIADEFVAQLVNSLDVVPYGIRWISRQISELFKVGLTPGSI
ncbi:RasGTPase-activating protein [Pelomyxa schiedti]|nr:RasGTPase-activating protein [Pelomyxa schiedti]